MSLEQFCLPNVQDKKPWMFFNGTAVSTNFLIVGPPVMVQDGLKSILAPPMPEGVIVYPNSLPAVKSDKAIIGPTYLIEDTGNGVLQFVNYTPASVSTVVNENFNALFQYYTVAAGSPLVSVLNNNCPLFIFTTQTPSNINDMTYIKFPLDIGNYTFYFRQFDYGTSGIFTFRFNNGSGAPVSENTINLSSQGLGVHTFSFTVINSVAGLCSIFIECVGSSSGSFDSNIIDTWIIRT